MINPPDSLEGIARAHHLRTLWWFLLAMAALLTPFDINHFLQGRFLLGGVLACVIGFFLANAISIQIRNRSIVPPLLFFAPIGATLWIAITVQGVSGVLWTYPCVLLAHQTLSRRSANVVAGALSVMSTALAYLAVGPHIAVRVGATLMITIVFANIFLGSITDLMGRLEELATIDPLTGVHNRRHMDACIATPLERKNRHGTPASLLLIDIDHFKPINDRFGHFIGDQVLKEVAMRLRRTLRTVDLLFRIGGEEFLALLPEADQSVALRVAERLRAAIADHPLHGERTVTVSIGAAELRAGEDAASLLKRCDGALYQAKTQGRNRVATAT